ncbi:hypothetical protein ABIB25_003067 [Nakamurella sp. UYEF19]|uniref:hypothetical protein n=1 Tax=Nakamurella sp. UYEF19 TaxID=1756392 RepID=UPI0033962292
MAVTEDQVSFEASSATTAAAMFTERSTQDYADGPNPLDDALTTLLAVFDGRGEQVEALREEFEIRVRCWGSSGSAQGGFWLSSGVIRRVGQLGAEFRCTANLATSDG